MQTPVFFLLGPTAVGKTDVAITLAEQFPQIALISVDSAMVYRRMNIGTGKPDAETLSRIPHQLIDIREPWQPYSAADFQTDARQAIAHCHAQNKIPFLVGGTFLYIKALWEGLSNLPPACADIRAHIQAMGAIEGWPAIHAQLATVDPITAQRLAPQDSQRITRAMEVYQLTGRPLSDLLAEHRSTPQSTAYSAPILSFVLNTPTRAQLHTQIANRFYHMMAQGFLEEVRALLAEPLISPHLSAMRAVGYRQLIDYCCPSAEHPPHSLNTAIERGIAATRQLAKRQLTWLRRLPTLPHFDDARTLMSAIRAQLLPFAS